MYGSRVFDTTNNQPFFVDKDEIVEPAYAFEVGTEFVVGNDDSHGYVIINIDDTFVTFCRSEDVGSYVSYIFTDIFVENWSHGCFSHRYYECEGCGNRNDTVRYFDDFNFDGYDVSGLYCTNCR